MLHDCYKHAASECVTHDDVCSSKVLVHESVGASYLEGMQRLCFGVELEGFSLHDPPETPQHLP